jgi:hypothetical protein
MHIYKLCLTIGAMLFFTSSGGFTIKEGMPKTIPMAITMRDMLSKMPNRGNSEICSSFTESLSVTFEKG